MVWGLVVYDGVITYFCACNGLEHSHRCTSLTEGTNKEAHLACIVAKIDSVEKKLDSSSGFLRG